MFSKAYQGGAGTVDGFLSLDPTSLIISYEEVDIQSGSFIRVDSGTIVTDSMSLDYTTAGPVTGDMYVVIHSPVMWFLTY